MLEVLPFVRRQQGQWILDFGVGDPAVFDSEEELTAFLVAESLIIGGAVAPIAAPAVEYGLRKLDEELKRGR